VLVMLTSSEFRSQTVADPGRGSRPWPSLVEPLDRQCAIRVTADRLARWIPEVPPDEEEQAVYRHYDTFSASPIRDLVPVLVEKVSRRRVAKRANRRAAAVGG